MGLLGPSSSGSIPSEAPPVCERNVANVAMVPIMMSCVANEPMSVPVRSAASDDPEL